MLASPRERHRYLHLLDLPGARQLALAGALHRSASFVLSFAVTLMLARELGSYAQAGAGAALFVLASAAAEPLQGRACDRLGALRPLLTLSVLFGVSLTAMTCAVVAGAPLPAVYALSLAAGGTMPFVRGPMRAAWWWIASSEKDRVTASMFESTAGPLAYCLGYALFAAYALFAGPAGAIIVAGTLVIAGTLTFSRLVARHGDPRAEHTERRHMLAVLANPRLLAVLGINLCVFWLHGLLQVALIARFSDTQASVMLALILAATAGYGFAFGHRHPKGAPEQELRNIMVPFFAVTVGLAAAATAPLGVLLIALLVHGALRNPVLAWTYHLSASYPPEQSRTEGVAWNGAAIMLGMALGKAVGGATADQISPDLILAGGVPVAAAALAFALWLRTRQTG